MKQKSKVTDIFLNFHKIISTQFGVGIKRIRTNNAKEYFDQPLTIFFQSEGILHESLCVDTPKQSRIAERKNRHPFNVTRSMLFQTHVPKKF